MTMMRELHACWRRLRDNDDVTAVVLTVLDVASAV
jgi:enoyl-CoA hydratase/carnithine racemase